MEYTINSFAMMTPMRYYSSDDERNIKRQRMIENYNNEYIASCKKDGDWSMLIHYTKGHNLIRSRSISKVTGEYGNYTEKVPHICEAMDLLPNNTVILAELCWDEPGTNANTVGTILRCLPAKAVERQKDKKLKAVAFDILMFDGQSLMDEPYWKRVALLEELFYSNYNHQVVNGIYEGNPLQNHPYFYPTEFYHDNFAVAARDIIAAGGEGIVIQHKYNTYTPGTRTAWKTLKLKQTLPEMELRVVGTLDPKKYYEGDCPETWEYELTDVETGEQYLVTKPYFHGWKNGITVELPDGNTCDVTSGLTDDDRAWLASESAAELIAAGDVYAVISAMSFNDRGKLRHPSLVRIRIDM